MSYYYKYQFTSVQPIYAIVKEELRSYFDSTSVDDVLFPIWTNQCLQKLGKSSYEIIPTLINVNNFVAILPDDFLSVREAWMCSSYSTTYTAPSAEYSQIIAATSTRVGGMDLRCNVCNECENPPLIQAIYKTTNTVAFQYKQKHLLKPGIINQANCPSDTYCANYNSSSLDTYDVKKNKFVTNFKEGVVYLLYYSEQFDENQELLIPDTYRTKQFIQAFLKQKVMEQLFNQTTDETFAQIKYKYEMYKQQSDEAFILADTDNKKEDIYRKARAIKRTLSRFSRYNIN